MKYCPNCWKDANSDLYEPTINYFSCCSEQGSSVPPSVRLPFLKAKNKATTMMLFALGLAVGIAFALALYLTTLPVCNENESIIGSGSFTSGRWSTYVCGPALDDFIE